MRAYKLLVVDDEPNITRILAYELKKEGYDIIIANDGREALERTKNEKPDLIVSDIMMPNMDGYDFCRQLKEDPNLRSIPFIFLTAKTAMDNKVYGYSIGAQKYLTKPVNKEELLKAVNIRLKYSNEAIKLFAKKAKKFEGDLYIISIFSLIDMFSIGAWSGFVDLKSVDGRTGRIEVFEGLIQKCAIDGQQDANTWTILLGWNQGTFKAVHE
jgi:two-component system response regulator VicR